ncbi:hypothetical protein DZG00_05725 [Clavibacter lycopersici]|uniref:Uncharacterized protein n=1 Tax=Clavibacter lycopersici TaxID=2301718 RepID=A0A399T7E9_9MICO|nr:hypothetical protein DZG00_05725 [Clavibacter lycopersici]
MAEADASTGSGVGGGVGDGELEVGGVVMSGSAGAAEQPARDRVSMSAMADSADAERGTDPPGSHRA